MKIQIFPKKNILNIFQKLDKLISTVAKRKPKRPPLETINANLHSTRATVSGKMQ